MDTMRRELTYTVTLQMRYRKGSGNMLVGQCKEFPFVIVQGKTVDELIQRVFNDLLVYFNTFPDKADAFMKEHGKVVSERVVAVQNIDAKDFPPAKRQWQEKEVVCTVPG